MKICFVNSFYPPYVGGAERYVSSVARKLSEMGHEVTIYCASRPLSPGESYDGKIKVVRMRTPMMFYGTPISFFPESFYREDYDVIHANFPSPYMAFVASLASRVRAIPSVLTWHNDLPAVTQASKLIVGVHDALAGPYLKNYSRIIATTRIYAERSRILRRFADRVVVIPNGVDTERFNPSVKGDRIREKYGLNGKIVALFVGAMTPWHRYKGLDYLLKAFAISRKRNSSLVLMVVGSGSLLPYYRGIARDLNILDAVIFAGFVDDYELPEYYAASDFLVLPSVDSSEGFGLVLLEAMACGKPVIGSAVGGIVEVVKQGVNGLLSNPRDELDLAEKILELSEPEGRKEEIAKAGPETARSCSWQRVTQLLLAVYGEITN